MARMTRIAVIEDDLPTSNQLRGWIEAARPGIAVHQWFTRDDAFDAAFAEGRLLSISDAVALARQNESKLPNF